MNKLPPIEKIYEAYSAITDGRVLMQESDAKVDSSNREKTYTVTWEDEIYTSNDNASYWQGYAGYPVIAVLMLQGKLPFNREIAAEFSGINWTELNAKHKRNYGAAVEEALKGKTVSAAAAVAAAEQVYEQLKTAAVVMKRSKQRPPK